MVAGTAALTLEAVTKGVVVVMRGVDQGGASILWPEQACALMLSVETGSPGKDKAGGRWRSALDTKCELRIMCLLVCRSRWLWEPASGR